MPQVEIRYSDDLDIQVESLFSQIAAAINEMDSSAGICKSRAYPATQFLHTHMFLSMMILKKPHRDNGFIQTLRARLDKIVSSFLPAGCYYSIELIFSGEHYMISQVPESGEN